MTPSRRSSRLSAVDWVDAALGLLAAEGVRGVKISRLCEELAVTKGSFYWHFTDLDALWEAMAVRWQEVNRLRVAELHGLTEMPADARLIALSTMLISDSHLTVEKAIRDWARSNEKVAETVRNIDGEIFKVVDDTLQELTMSADKARLLAGLLVYAGIGFIHGHDGLPTPTPEELRHAISGLILSAAD
ncbi:TetR/AcrR family transcriptional regulator [Gordonia sp. HY002]|uniref:TetR/AcrR family transcriptional regulator n=1 Tax=Gordonia zhenghanii TaxID=2911516 RepID=UPI001EF022E9|nr:TetR/AcrR family transcriptional regulator [Gordonia zhenghanii]MCF8571242.1 TetR/AcrR family transcriptional regulator [Gordonia zhenghanii]MCF8601766.1 TetR/AcrR family transcriptional regulator [Gordonia zhenghanii]